VRAVRLAVRGPAAAGPHKAGRAAPPPPHALTGRRRARARRNDAPPHPARAPQVTMTETASEIKLFGKWTYDDVEVNDISLEDYIAVKGKHSVYLPHTAGRYQKKRFRKALCPITERLVCALMRKGRNNGKKLKAVRIVQSTLEIVHLLTDQNPVQVLVQAIIQSGPREDSTRVGSAGVVRRQAVDMSPFRRVNMALYLLCTGAREAAFRNVKTIAECLADEVINAARGSSNSYAIKKKDEIERVAKANR
jgi:small subunit ribosomal protein S5e